jgi:hypothetical protein
VSQIRGSGILLTKISFGIPSQGACIKERPPSRNGLGGERPAMLVGPEQQQQHEVIISNEGRKRVGRPKWDVKHIKSSSAVE